MDIETAATSAIKNRIADTDLLSQYINERDKEPVWDGAIYAYRSTSFTNENLIGKAPVQVKGKLSKSISKKAITYSVSIINLTHYRNDGGVLYFVVYLTASREKKIYYAALTPFVLNRYVGIAKGKKSTSISLRELPSKDTDFENVVINFINERHRQIQSKNGKNWTLKEVTELLGVNNVRMNCHFTCLGYDRNNPFEYLKNNELYLYAQNEDGSLSFPVEHIEHVESMIHEQKVDVSANGKIYYKSIQVERRRDESDVLHFGKSITFILKEHPKFNYSLKGNLDEQIQTIHFLLDVIDDKGLYINGIKLQIEPTTKELENLDREAVEDKLRYLELIKETLDKLGICKSLEVDELTDKQERNLRMLINAILYGREAGFEEKDPIPPVVTLDIANLKIMLLFRPLKSGRYEVNDFFRTPIECKVDREGDYPTSQFTILAADNFLTVDNLDWSIIEEGLKEFDNEGNYERVIFVVLELIKAFDIDNSQSQWLERAKSLCRWLEEKTNDNLVNRINLLQCLRRTRELNDAELDELEQYLLRDDINEMTKAALNILLENKNSAERIIRRLPKEEQSIFMDYPIYNLFEELK